MPRRRKRRYGEGSVYRCRRTGRWVAAVMVAGERRMAYADTEERAERLRATLATGRIPPAQQTLAAYLLEWLADLEASDSVRPNTLTQYQWAVKEHISPGLGRLRMERITPRDVQAFIRGLSDRLGPTSVRQVRTILSVALRRSVRMEILDRNVVALTDPPPAAPRSRRAMGSADQAAFLAAVRGHRLEALYLLAMTTGLRIGEALGLRWAEVDMGGHRLTVARQMLQSRQEMAPVKTDASNRRVPFPEMAARALVAHRTRQRVGRLASRSWRDLDLVFCSEDGRPLGRDRVNGELTALCVQAGIPRYTFHELRHTTASALLNDGESLKTVSSLLGHASIAVTADLYGHTDEPAKTRAAARFDRLLSETAE